MGDISIIELGVYMLIAYSGLLMLIISSIREAPATKSQSFTRALYLVPSIVCAGLLASAGQVVDLNDETVITTAPDGAITTETHVKTFTLINEVWISVHFMIFILLLFHVILQSLSLLMFKN